MELEDRQRVRQLETHVSLLLQLKAEYAAIGMSRALERLSLLLRSYNPEQPRVPAGSGRESGRWSGDGATIFAQAGTGRLAAGPGGQFPGATPVQRALYYLSAVRRTDAVARIRDVDPGWRPRASLTAPESIESQTARYEAEARQAERALAEFYRPAREQENLNQCFAPNGRRIGERGSDATIRLVPQEQFDDVLVRSTRDAIPVRTPERYAGQWFQRPDGSIIGLRDSVRNAWTIDIVKSSTSFVPPVLKVHSK